MKTLKRITTILVLLAIPYLVSAQSKEEQKKLKAELKTYKKMKPDQIRQIKLNYEKKLDGLNAMTAQLKQSRSTQDSLQQVVNSMQGKFSAMETELQQAKSAAKKDVPQGYYYRVQLGAYKNFQVKNKPAIKDESITEEKADGMNKYVVGVFKTFEEADAFKNDMRKMGMKDAFVVPFKDSKRITHKEAIEGIKSQSK